MTCHVAYVLWSDKLQKRYVGYTRDPQARLSQHNQGWAKFTSRGIPWRLEYTEEYATLDQAPEGIPDAPQTLTARYGRSTSDTPFRNP